MINVDHLTIQLPEILLDTCINLLSVELTVSANIEIYQHVSFCIQKEPFFSILPINENDVNDQAEILYMCQILSESYKVPTVYTDSYTNTQRGLQLLAQGVNTLNACIVLKQTDYNDRKTLVMTTIETIPPTPRWEERGRERGERI